LLSLGFLDFQTVCWCLLIYPLFVLFEPSPMVAILLGIPHYIYWYGSIPVNTIFRGLNIHLPAILMFTRGTRFWHTAIYKYVAKLHSWNSMTCANFVLSLPRSWGLRVFYL
jgi:hypothetical protein